jgi:two-component system response regulator HydG
VTSRLLIVDDDPDLSSLLSQYLQKRGLKVDVEGSGKSALDRASHRRYDLILLDIGLPDMDGLEVLKQLRTKSPDTRVVMITAYSDVKTAVAAMKNGAFDYIAKPIFQEEVYSCVQKALSPGPELAPASDYIHGESIEAKSIEENIQIIGPTDLSVIIQGETGIGKEYVARSIHDHSKRRTSPFVAIDCGALPHNLAESILFGHMKGSFTDAVSDKKGHFEAAHHGTLFLDEIGNLSYELQIKLLRVLQERKFMRVGGNADISVDVRLIAASNNDLAEGVKKGTFREDLYHRLNEFKINIPPLRARREDIELYTLHFLAQANKDLGRDVKGVSAEAMTVLLKYPWYGNLRELKNVVKRATLLASTDKITPEDLPSEIASIAPKKTEKSIETPAHDHKLVAGYAEREVIVQALEKVRYRKVKAAQLLNVDRKTLYNKMKLYNIPSKPPVSPK